MAFFLFLSPMPLSDKFLIFQQEFYQRICGSVSAVDAVGYHPGPHPHGLFEASTFVVLSAGNAGGQQFSSESLRLALSGRGPIAQGHFSFLGQAVYKWCGHIWCLAEPHVGSLAYGIKTVIVGAGHQQKSTSPSLQPCST